MFEEGNAVPQFLDDIGLFIKALAKVPNWRFMLAILLLGEDVSKALKKIIT